jgi:hypothetical protein
MRRTLAAIAVCGVLLIPAAAAVTPSKQTAAKKPAAKKTVVAKAKVHKRQPLENTTASPYWFRYPQFSDAEVRLVLNWFQDTYEAGRRQIAAVPSAVRAEFHRGARLTAAAFQHLTTPPPELLAKLPPMPSGYERMLAGSTLVIVKTDEQLVVDALATGTR